MELLNLENVSKEYTLKDKQKILAVDNVSLSVKEGKCIGLVGESGCGKSTLGKLIVGLEEATNGNISFKGDDIQDLKYSSTSRHELQMTFQNSLDAVNRRKSAHEIISEPIKNFYKLSKEEIDTKVVELLSKVGIEKNEKNKFPHQFSGGQLQRICIARSLASQPKLLVLDEPLSSLDVSVQAQILNLLSDLKKDLNLTYILISHDLEAVYYLSDSIVVMYGGKIVEQIDDINCFKDLKHPYTKRLLSSSYAYRSKLKEQSIEDLSFKSNTMNQSKSNGCPYFNRCNIATKRCFNNCPELIDVSKGHKIACHNIK